MHFLVNRIMILRNSSQENNSDIHYENQISAIHLQIMYLSCTLNFVLETHFYDVVQIIFFGASYISLLGLHLMH